MWQPLILWQFEVQIFGATWLRTGKKWQLQTELSWDLVDTGDDDDD